MTENEFAMKVGKEIIEIKTTLLVKSPLNPRRYLGDIAELGDTIAQKGIIEPLIVLRRDDKFEVIVGERRRQSAFSLGLETLPCRIAELSEWECLQLIAIEDYQREELAPLERFELYSRLHEKLDYKEIAALVGTSVNAVKCVMAMQDVDESIREKVRQRTSELKSIDRTITLSKAIEFKDLPKEVQKTVASIIERKGLSEKDVRKQATNFEEAMIAIRGKEKGFEDVTEEDVQENIEEILAKGKDFFNVPAEREYPVLLKLYLKSASDIETVLAYLKGLKIDFEADV